MSHKDVSRGLVFELFTGDQMDLLAALDLQRTSTTTVRHVRGLKCIDVEGMWDEFAAALQFPSYFGENWPAFDECLWDLDFEHPTDAFTLVVLTADKLLTDPEPGSLEVLVRYLIAATENYATAVADGRPWDRPAIAMRVILQCSPGVSQDCRERWQEAGAAIQELVL